MPSQSEGPQAGHIPISSDNGTTDHFQNTWYDQSPTLMNDTLHNEQPNVLSMECDTTTPPPPLLSLSGIPSVTPHDM